MKPCFETELGALYHGDCFDIIPHLSQQPEILLTDPMYGIEANTRGKSTNRGKRKKLRGGWVENRDWNIMHDDKPFDPTQWLHYKQAIIWGGNHFADKLPASSKWIIWDKRCKETNRDDNADCEMAWTNLKGVSRVFHHLWKGVCRAGEENLSRQGAKLHPFQKPVALISFCLQQFSLDEHSIVIDPFAGSGTTGIACERMGIHWILIEKEKHFCDTIVERFDAETRQISMVAAWDNKKMVRTANPPRQISLC
jgi:site-specific DNA-methyltransferase (adenine-specific)/modification methylase